MKKKTGLFMALSLTAAMAVTGCAGNTPDANGNAAGNGEVVSDNSATDAAATDETTAGSEGGVLYVAANFAYSSLDPHKEYYAWYDSLYGMTESLFVMGDDFDIVPKLAESGEVSDDGLTWTIVVRDDVTFSNGNSFNADIAVKNIERLAEINERFAYLADFTYATEGDKTLKITTPGVYPTMLSDLTAPETGIMDLDGTTDFDNAPVCTGPFVIKSFEPEGTVVVEKNASYWNGEVKLDGVTFYYMQDDETKLNAMQAGDIDGYTSVTAAAKEIFATDPSKYVLTEIPATRLQFYVLNKNRLDDKVRQAINLTVDVNSIAAFLGGTVSPAVGPFSAAAPYGQVKKPAVDTEKAKKLLEEDGYVLGSDGFYAKDGETLNLSIGYYAARSLDSIAILMQDQFKNVGIKASLNVQEDPDSTYIATGDYDIALYCMIADKAGDPYYACDALFRKDSKWALGGFANQRCEALIDQLQYETDINKRAQYANQIVQMSIDDNAFGYVGLFNKTTVTKKGVTGIAERCPFDFYGVNANTDIP